MESPQTQAGDGEPRRGSLVSPAGADSDGPGNRHRRGDRTRTKILEAAGRVFGREGFHGASIVEITREADVGLGTFYVYFPSKIEIYRHFLRSLIDDFVRVAREASIDADDYPTMVRDAFKAFFGWIADRPGALRLLREADYVDPKLLAELYRLPAEKFRQRLERGMELGFLPRADAEVLAWSLMGMTEFAVLRWVVWGEDGGLDEQRLEAFAQIVVRAAGFPVAPAHDA